MFAASATDPTPILHVNTFVASFVAGPVVALVTALATRINASSAVKAIVNLVLSVVGGLCAYLLAHNGDASIIQLATVMITVYVASGVSYTHLLKPIGLVGAVQAATANFGVGGSSTNVVQ